ncbi:hypothetical protein BGW39_002305 [Mortierella sp. 14UC]|nr:hypothetical protein BGW39_002305 [Mortierella sp. 14UC]
MSASQPSQLLIFEIPHIQDDICSYFTRESIAHCAVVSQTWKDLFTPYLYRTVELTHIKILAHFKDNAHNGDGSSSCPAVAALLRYRGHVQTLKVSEINQVMQALLGPFLDASASGGVPVSSLPKTMRAALESWKFGNLRHFEWTATKGLATSSSSDSNSNNENDDGSMTALQLVVLHIDRLESVSLKFRTLTRQHVRILKRLLRGGEGGGRCQVVRLRKLFIMYQRADVLQSVMKRFIWAALSLYKPLPVGTINNNNYDDDDDEAGTAVGDGYRNGLAKTTTMLDTFHLMWDRDGQYGWDRESDSDTENDDNDDDAYDVEELDGDNSNTENGHSSTTNNGSPSPLANLGNISTSSSSPLPLTLQSLHPPRKSPIKHLTFGFDTTDILTLHFQPLLERCPDLESISLWTIESLPVLNELPDLLQRFCPRFKSLGVGFMNVEDGEIAQLVAGCVERTTPTTTTIMATGTEMTKKRRGGLESFRILAQNDFDEISTLALGRYHGASLETLDFAQQTRFPAHLFLQLLKHCPRLRILKCNIELRMEHQGQTIDYSSLFSISPTNTTTTTTTTTIDNASNNNNWPFASTLKFLDLSVYRGSDLEIDSNFRHGDRSISDRFIAHLYAQIARLTRLQEWHLGGWMVLLRIGWGLEKLSDLKSLKVLDVREHTFVRWTEDEVTWMAENWTGLVEIWGVKGPHLQPVIQHLKALRPMVQIL